MSEYAFGLDEDTTVFRLRCAPGDLTRCTLWYGDSSSPETPVPVFPAEMALKFHGENDESDWEVTLAGTGLNTMTGGRVFRASRYLRDEDENFFLTYGDGVSDIDLAALYRHHLASDKLLTISAVHPEARFGEMILDGDDVVGFEEKPAQVSGYINGGFMVLNRAFLTNYLKSDEELFFEREPMRRCAADGKMQIYRHEGFWQCMDNPREYALLNSLWESGNAPWTKFWK